MKTLAKFGIGLAIAIIIFWKAPITEVASLFFMGVLIPLGILVSLGLISSASLDFMNQKYREAIGTFMDGFANGLREKEASLNSPGGTATATEGTWEQ